MLLISHEFHYFKPRKLYNYWSHKYCAVEESNLQHVAQQMVFRALRNQCRRNIVVLEQSGTLGGHRTRAMLLDQPTLKSRLQVSLYFYLNLQVL